MTTISKIAEPMVKNGITSKLKNKALILAATAALIPTIANAKTATVKDAEPVQTETTTTTNNSESNSSSQTYYVYETYPVTYEFNAGRAYNMGSQFGVTIGADYYKSATSNLQTLGPYINISGKAGGRVNGVYDVDVKGGFDLPEIETKSPNLDAYAAVGIGVDVARAPRTCFSVDLAPEGTLNTYINKAGKYDSVEGNWGVGGRLRLTLQQGICRNTRMKLSASGSYGAAGAIYSSDYWINSGVHVYDISGNRVGQYLRAVGELKFDIGVLSIGGYINYLKRSADALIPTEGGDGATSEVSRETWGGGARIGFRFGN